MLRATAAAEPQEITGAVAGGYRLIPVVQVAMVWWAYKRGLIRYIDLRTWFGCHELVARRCVVRPGEPVRYSAAELDGLVGGVGGKRREASLGRLQKAGLLTWSSSAITFAASPDGLPTDDLAAFWSFFNAVPNHNRKLPVPRRTVREIAGGLKPVVVATMLGHLLRCVYLWKGAFEPEGCCKASWIAETFGVDVRGVKRARRHLACIGWLTLKPSEQWHRQRYGARVVVNLGWSRKPSTESVRPSPSVSEEPRRGLPPRAAVFSPELPPPESDKDLSSRFRNQKPASRGPAGFSAGKVERKNPTMRHVELWDLKDTGRLLLLFRDAVARELVGESEGERLLFVGAAERALFKGTVNPCGLFVRLVRGRLWDHVTNSDEDAAHERLKAHLYGVRRKREASRPVRPKPVRVELSDDARLVVAVQRVARERRFGSDAFYLVRQVKPEWTRERWDAAVAELERARFAQLRVNAGAAVYA
jgi:hypothetical protein